MVNSFNTSTWLLLTNIIIALTSLGLLRSGPTQAAIIQVTPHGYNRKPFLQEQPLETHTDQPIFVLLTTGQQIKLYQAHRTRESSSSWSLTGHNFVVNSTSSLLTLSKPGQPFIELLGNTTYSRWLAELSSIKSTKASILPASRQDNIEYSASKTGWRQPLIVDVDYFFDRRFCPADDEHVQVASQCLVVVWLDKSNNFVHYGSINMTGILSSLTKPVQQKAKIIELNEFPPFDLLRNTVKRAGNYSAQAHSMVIDKRRNKLHVAISDGTQSMANKIITGRLRNYKQVFGTHRDANSRSSLLEQTLTTFNDQCKTSEGANSTFKNLSVDEATGGCLFYLDQHKGGQIFALGSNEYNSHMHALVRGNLASSSDLAGAATSMTLDPEGRRLIWFTENNLLYSCNLAGADLKTLGQLSARPVIRSSSTIQLFRDTLFISDPVKRSLLTYDMKTHTSTKPTHEVLLVDMPAVYGFRLVVTSSGESNLDFVNMEEDTESANDGIGGEPIKSIGEVEQVQVAAAKTWLDQVFSYFKTAQSSSNYELDYMFELASRTNLADHCGYNQIDYVQLVQEHHDKLLLFIIELAILHIAFFIWFVFPWMKQKFHRASSQANLISSSITDLDKHHV